MRLAKQSFAALATFWVAFCIAGPSRAADPPPCAAYTLAFYELGALYGRGAGGVHEGIDKDLVEELSRRSGCVFTTVLESRVRIWDRLSRRLLDLSVSGIATPEREVFAEFIPYFQTRNYVLVTRKVAAEVPTPIDFLADKLRTVAVVKSFKHGALYDAWLDQLRAQRRVFEMADFPAAWHSLQLGRVDAVLALPTVWGPLLRQPQLKQQYTTLDWSPNDRIEHGLIVSKARVAESDKQRLRAAIQSMLRDGTVEATFARHLGEVQAKQMRIEAVAVK